jgi:hypothetical protein
MNWTTIIQMIAAAPMPEAEGSNIRPRRYGGQSDTDTQRQQDQPQRGGDKCASNDRSPRYARRICFVCGKILA